MKANRRGGILVPPPRCFDPGHEAVVHLQACQTGIPEIIPDSTWFGKGCINNKKFGAKSKHAYRSPTERD